MFISVELESLNIRPVYCPICTTYIQIKREFSSFPNFWEKNIGGKGVPLRRNGGWPVNGDWEMKICCGEDVVGGRVTSFLMKRDVDKGVME
ncbi:hypothetical protein [Chitinophaga sp. XS-30]|uniref:hypothetical protein n=1 Tax=Chitinophaga sp. XS-30 TaxID=2604421 RepID=UPI0011DCAF61|nr:hypothetical protein [Chitinophaga sp. XS-30]QEH40750.1 hypothetical protein FW415_07615 [Chitinophaga sp. XS-30]